MITTKSLLGLATLAALAAVGPNALASVTETIYGLNSFGGIDFTAPLYSFTLGGSLNLGNQSTTLLSSGDASFGAWSLPGADSYGAELTGDVTAPSSGWYTFDVHFVGNAVEIDSQPGEGTDTKTETTAFLPGGDSAFDFKYAKSGDGAPTGVTFYVQGDDPIQGDLPPDNGDFPRDVPDAAGVAGLFPVAFCALHAARRRWAGK